MMSEYLDGEVFIDDTCPTPLPATLTTECRATTNPQRPNVQKLRGIPAGSSTALGWQVIGNIF